MFCQIFEVFFYIHWKIVKFDPAYQELTSLMCRRMKNVKGLKIDSKEKETDGGIKYRPQHIF